MTDLWMVTFQMHLGRIPRILGRNEKASMFFCPLFSRKERNCICKDNGHRCYAHTQVCTHTCIHYNDDWFVDSCISVKSVEMKRLEKDSMCISACYPPGRRVEIDHMYIHSMYMLVTHAHTHPWLTCGWLHFSTEREKRLQKQEEKDSNKRKRFQREEGIPKERKRRQKTSTVQLASAQQERIRTGGLSKSVQLQ